MATFREEPDNDHDRPESTSYNLDVWNMICVHGLGREGSATAALFANNGWEVVGFDFDDSVVDRFQKGRPEVGEPKLSESIIKVLEEDLSVRTSPVQADHHIVCVSAPYDEERGEAVLAYIEQAGRTVAEVLRPDDSVIVESTVPPGTTTGVFSRAVSQAGHVPGEEFDLSYAAKTVMPDNAVEEILQDGIIVGGVNDSSANEAMLLYESVSTGKVQKASNPTTAEFTKLAQYAARDVEMAYANTLAMAAEDYGVEIQECIDLAKGDSSFDIPDPGLVVDDCYAPDSPLFLGRWSEKISLIDCARSVNNRVPEYIAEKISTAIDSGKNKRIAVLGITSHGNISETRRSPGLAIARFIQTGTNSRPQLTDGGISGIEVRLHDPYATDSTLNLYPLEEALCGADAAVIAADHSVFNNMNPDRIRDLMKGETVFDAANILDQRRWRDSGFEILSL